MEINAGTVSPFPQSFGTAQRLSIEKPEGSEPEIGKGGQSPQGAVPNELSEVEQREVERLKKRDEEVRLHEATHKQAAGSLATGGPFFKFETGPDGKAYAVEGHVTIDTQPVSGDPQATIEKAQRIERAALAPADPSAQDRQVAGEARQMAAKARQELSRQQKEQGLYGQDGQQRAPGVSSLGLNIIT